MFAYLGIDEWVVGLCGPLFTSLAANPYAFVVGIAVATIVLRFLIVSEMAYINILMAFMVPLSSSLGIDPWIVGVCAYATVNPLVRPLSEPDLPHGVLRGRRRDGKSSGRWLVTARFTWRFAWSVLVVSVPFRQAMGIL